MEGVVGLIILVITAIGWVVNALNEQKAPPPKPAPGQRPKPQRKLQEEIEGFLKEIQQQQPVQQQPARPVAVDPQAARREQQPVKPRPQTPKRSEANRPRKNSPQAGRQAGRPIPPSTAAPSTGLPSPLNQQSIPTLDAALRSEAEQGLSKDLLERLTPEQVVGLKKMLAARDRQVREKTGPRAIRDMLSSGNIQNSFVINEILQPPLALRKKS